MANDQIKLILVLSCSVASGTAGESDDPADEPRDEPPDDCVCALLQLHAEPSTDCTLDTIISPSGRYMAAFDSKKSFWRVTTVKPKKQVATKNQRDAVVKDLEQLEAGEHKWQKKNEPTAVLAQMDAFDRNQKILPNRSTRPDFDTPTRVGNWYKGGPTPPLKEISKPSQAKKRKAVIPITASLSPTKAAQKLIDSSEHRGHKGY